MPPKSGKKNSKKNVGDMAKSGQAPKQALAAAYKKARESSAKGYQKGK